MEIRLKCNDSLELNNLDNLKTILLDILSYNLIGDTLKGDVMIDGEYFMKGEEQPRGFEDIVPFTMVFRNDNIQIDDITIDNFNYEISKDNIISLKFEIVVEYTIIDKIETEEIIEVPVEIDEYEEVSSNNDIVEETFCSVKDQKIEENVIYDDEKELTAEINNLEKEEIEITKKYDQLLDKIMNVREDNNNKNNKNSSMFSNQKTSYNSITVFYLNKESEIESISKERRISIQDIYNKNDDFAKTRRIIINE